MSLELALAGSWISFVAWLIVFILMITLRQHLKAHLTDESMWGSQYGGRSRYGRSSSRMSDRSFDAGSRISNQSGSRYSGYRGGSRHNGNKSLPDQMIYLPTTNLLPKCPQMEVQKVIHQVDHQEVE